MANKPSRGDRSRATQIAIGIAALLGVGALVAGVVTATGGDDRAVDERAVDNPTDADGSAGASVANGQPEPASPTTSTEGSPARATTIEELQAQWTEARATVVKSLSAQGYGLGADNIVRGPGGFEVDLSRCPADWSNTQGLTDNTITIGHTTALTGTLAASGRVTAGMQAYFDDINSRGGIGGRQLEMVVKDDQFVAANAIQALGELMAVDQPFLITTLGSPSTLAVYNQLNDACVPQPFVITSHPAWGDPVNHPWTTGLQLSPSTEAVLWGNWIQVNLADSLPVKVGALVMDNEFGLLYEQSFQAWASANPDVVSEFQPVRHQATAPSVAAEMATIAGAQPDVYLSMTAGRPCLQAIQEAATSGLTTTAQALFTPSGCRDPATFLAPAGSAANGWRIVGGGVKSTTDPQWADDPFVAFVNTTLSADGLDTADSLFGSGFGLFGWAQVEALRIAAELPGGLTRANLLLALHSLDLQHPLLLDGIGFAASGNDDSYYIEGSDILAYDAATRSWRQDGPILDRNGSTPACAWANGSC